MKQLPLTSALICAACCVAMAVVALGGFYFAGFSWPVFAAMGLTTALIFTAGWLLGWRLARGTRTHYANFFLAKRLHGERRARVENPTGRATGHGRNRLAQHGA